MGEGAILLFRDLGERATWTVLHGWCGPLVPEDPTEGHDHRKRTLTWTDCQGADVLQGCVLTFTYSQWSHGTELVFADGRPHGTRADLHVDRAVLDWPTAWGWLGDLGGGCGLELARSEVQDRVARLIVQVLGSPFEGGAVLYRHRDGSWRLEDPRLALPLGMWRADGQPYPGEGSLPALTLSEGATVPEVWRALLVALRPQLEAMAPPSPTPEKP